jgi:CHAD domain-containing protein
VADERIAEWTLGLVKHDVRAFEAARSRFLERPTAKRLHALRISARRLRCLYDDFHETVPLFAIKGLRRLIELTGEARDAEVQRAVLRDALDPRERRAARDLLQALRKRSEHELQRVADALDRVHIVTP